MAYGTPAPADKRLNSSVEEQSNTLPPRHLWVYLAFVFTLLFTALHVYWAVGGTWGLPLLALHEKEAVRAANWVVSVIMLVGAALVLALAHPAGRRVPPWLLLGPLWVGSVVCVSHAFYGFVTKGLYLGGWHDAVDFPVVPGVDPATAADANHEAAVHDLLVFEPSFLVQGVLLALAGRQFLRTPRSRRRWTVSMVAGVLVVDVFGIVLGLTDMRVAIG